jgi:hypothetical protein
MLLMFVFCCPSSACANCCIASEMMLASGVGSWGIVCLYSWIEFVQQIRAMYGSRRTIASGVFVLVLAMLVLCQPDAACSNGCIASKMMVASVISSTECTGVIAGSVANNATRSLSDLL